jgi:serine/threonine protein kinase
MDVLSPSELQLVREWHHRLADLPPAEWPAALAASGLSGTLQQEVRDLLAEDPSDLPYLHELDAEQSGTLALLAMPAREHLSPGRLLCQRYEIEREIGSGGFSTVYVARDRRLDGRRVVLKLLPPQLLSHPRLFEHYRAEVAALSQLRHPNLISILDTDLSPDPGPLIVLEYIDGVTLREFLQRHGKLDAATTRRLLAQIAGALETAHARNIWHLDLKPENILIDHPDTAMPRAVVIDFGIAQLRKEVLGESGSSFPAGSPSYMAPEQFTGKPTQQSDVFALAVIAHEMLTGQRPAKPLLAGTTGASPKHPALPPKVWAVLNQALSQDPASRPARPIAFVNALRDVIEIPHARKRTRSAAIAAAALLGLVAVAALVYQGPIRWWQTSRIIEEVRQLERAAASVPVQTEDTPQVRIAFLNKAMEKLHALRAEGNLSAEGYELLIGAHFQKAMNLYHPSRLHLGRSGESAQEFSTSAAIADEMATKFPRDLRSAWYTSETRVGLGDLLVETGQFERAEQVLLDGIAFNRAALLQFPNEKKLLGYYAALLSTLSRVTEQRQDAGTTARLRDEMVEIRHRNYERSRNPVDYPHYIAYVGSLLWRGAFLHEQDEEQRALADCRRARAILAEGLPHAPSPLDRPWWFAQVDYLEGIVLLRQQDFPGALRHLQQAREQFTELEKQQAPNPALRRYLALTLSHLALAQRKSGQPLSACAPLQTEAESRIATAIQTDPTSTEAKKEAEIIRQNRSALTSVR